MEPVTDPSKRLLRATLSGDGRLGPIEERIGRRLVRLVDPRSEEGRAMLQARLVHLVGPGGEPFGKLKVDEACRRLRERLERRLSDPDFEEEREALREGLRRLDSRVPRIGHG